MTILRRCPCCNSVAITVDGVTFAPDHVLWDGGEYRWSARRSQAAIMWLLAARRGAIVSFPEIVDWIYADDPDGGPLDVRNCVDIAIVRLRRALREAGAPIEIHTHWGRGYELIIHSQERIGVAA